jgi:hypothetical protein
MSSRPSRIPLKSSRCPKLRNSHNHQHPNQIADGKRSIASQGVPTIGGTNDILSRQLQSCRTVRGGITHRSAHSSNEAASIRDMEESSFKPTETPEGVPANEEPSESVSFHDSRKLPNPARRVNPPKRAQFERGCIDQDGEESSFMPVVYPENEVP